MIPYARKGLLVWACLTIFTSCQKTTSVDNAFYYWSSDFQLSEQKNNLVRHVSNKLYVRFFDIKWNRKSNTAYPEAKIRFKQLVDNLRITPVIYITNETFAKTSLSGTDSLARNSYQLIKNIAGNHHIIFKAIQIDCDWTETTRDKYFRFLSAIKSLSKKKLEVTIRLHQVKYPGRTGIPPADIGILMFYNMGKLSADSEARNSIYNEEDAQKYVAYLSAYKLPLDVALPVFSWVIHIRNNKIIQIYSKLMPGLLEKQSNFKAINEHVFLAETSFFTKGIYFKKGDVLKSESVSVDQLKTASKQLVSNLSTQKHRTIIYYELSAVSFSEQQLQEISSVF